jgi:hypothetical protein
MFWSYLLDYMHAWRGVREVLNLAFVAIRTVMKIPVIVFREPHHSCRQMFNRGRFAENPMAQQTK